MGTQPTMSIEQQRAMIAQFMGMFGTDKFLAQFRYEESWDLLMEVGKKIFDWLQQDMKNRPAHTCTQGDLIEADITCAIREYNKEEAHKHIVRWIEWYNQKKY